MASRNKRAAPNAASLVTSRVRCAIYTRKSTEEGLDQAFNSLDAQREACAAYVLSQQHEGWTLLPDLYDDGGFSGGSMERPGLKRLMADIEANKVDVIIVYKVDRLTRSLADFAKIVDVLDAAGASFVSITQVFNTTSSMGRLTLNVLLSFAQFEREVTGERIRDKIAASKKKGMWMGGPIPLGYDLCERKLLINEVEAETVRLIFARYQEIGSLGALSKDLNATGIRSRVRQMRDGTIKGGDAYSAGALAHIPRNRIYVGEITHGEKVYPGAHEAIINRDIWDAVQVLLNRSAPRKPTGHTSPLAGRIFDDKDRPLYAEHAIKGDKRYRYYVSRGEGAKDGWRLPAGDIEAIVARELKALLSSNERLNHVLGRNGGNCAAAPGLQPLPTMVVPTDLSMLVDQLDATVLVSPNAVRLSVGRVPLAKLVGSAISAIGGDAPIHIDVPIQLRRRGHELRLIYAAPDVRPAQTDDRLIILIASGWRAWNTLTKGPRIADATKRSHLVRLARLRFLAPDIVTAIIEGRQPVELTARSLLRIADLPNDWVEQRRVLGF
jgi:site-specific DNA recombinase